MEIVNVPIKELKPAEYNPRQATEKQVADLTASIKKFGFAEPIIVNKNKDRQNVIVGGHFRVRVAKDMGLTDVPVVYVDLDAEKERELNLRLNKNLGEWDWDKLANEFDEALLKDVGWTDFDMKNLFEINPNEEDWAEAFDKETLPKELDGLKQVTFVLKEEQVKEVFEKLKQIDPDKNVAIYKAVIEYGS